MKKLGFEMLEAHRKCFGSYVEGPSGKVTLLYLDQVKIGKRLDS
jgi:hypothetical protein